ncbi:MAG: 1,4-dihydroxy-6-naphthoate synthase [bacterium]
MIDLSLGYSPCPNDTFIFSALVQGKVPLPEGITLRERLEDVETLNRMAFQEKLDISKVSCHAFGHVRNRYVLLRSGFALGKGCGPLLVERGEDAPAVDLTRQRIAVPGEFTTAFLLLRMYEPKAQNIIILPFNQILQAVRRGEADAGLIIHESRFTYQSFGLRKILDLGDFWEKESGGCPLPLGGIMVRRALGRETARTIEDAIRQSVRYARAHPEEAKDYIRHHAQEMEDSVIFSHIDLYVNEYTLDIGQDGEDAIRLLLAKAEARGIVPPSSFDLFR